MYLFYFLLIFCYFFLLGRPARHEFASPKLPLVFHSSAAASPYLESLSSSFSPFSSSSASDAADIDEAVEDESNAHIIHGNYESSSSSGSNVVIENRDSNERQSSSSHRK